MILALLSAFALATVDAQAVEEGDGKEIDLTQQVIIIETVAEDIMNKASETQLPIVNIPKSSANGYSYSIIGNLVFCFLFVSLFL